MVSISLWCGVVSFTIVCNTSGHTRHKLKRVFTFIFPSICLLLNMKRREDIVFDFTPLSLFWARKIF